MMLKNLSDQKATSETLARSKEDFSGGSSEVCLYYKKGCVLILIELPRWAQVLLWVIQRFYNGPRFNHLRIFVRLHLVIWNYAKLLPWERKTMKGSLKVPDTINSFELAYLDKASYDATYRPAEWLTYFQLGKTALAREKNRIKTQLVVLMWGREVSNGL